MPGTVCRSVGGSTDGRPEDHGELGTSHERRLDEPGSRRLARPEPGLAAAVGPRRPDRERQAPVPLHHPERHLDAGHAGAAPTDGAEPERVRQERVGRALLAVPTVDLEPLLVFRMKGIGYTHPEWGHGQWKGELAIGGESWKIEDADNLDLPNQHIQQIVRARIGDEEGILKGNTLEGNAIEGSDSVKIVKKKRWGFWRRSHKRK